MNPTNELPGQSNQPDSRPDEREALISRYQTEAMKQTDALRANMGVVGADLMRLMYRYGMSIEIAWAKNGPTRDLTRQTETMLKMSREIECFARFDRQMDVKTGPSE